MIDHQTVIIFIFALSHHQRNLTMKELHSHGDHKSGLWSTNEQNLGPFLIKNSLSKKLPFGFCQEWIHHSYTRTLTLLSNEKYGKGN